MKHIRRMATIGLRGARRQRKSCAMQALLALALAAANPSIAEQLQRIPRQTWINLGICLLAVVGIVWLWRVLKKFNDFAPYFAAVLAAVLIFFYWVYERSEPAFLTPLVDRIAPFFPTRGRPGP